MNSKTENFLALHRPGEPFILANVWDIGSARLLAANGAVALATTSAGHAFCLGVPDMGNVSREAAVAHATELAAATDLPVSADFENGYGDSPEAVAETAKAAAAAGLAGFSIEDVYPPNGEPYSLPDATARIEAAAAAKGNCVLTARADGMMYGKYNADEAIRRLQEFERAGADVLYAPMPPDMETLAVICKAVNKPVNAIAAGQFCNYTVADFAKIGVARISLGSSLARVTHAAIIHAAKAMLEQGDFSPLTKSVGSGKVDKMLIAGSPIGKKRSG